MVEERDGCMFLGIIGLYLKKFEFLRLLQKKLEKDSICISNFFEKLLLFLECTVTLQKQPKKCLKYNLKKFQKKKILPHFFFHPLPTPPPPSSLLPLLPPSFFSSPPLHRIPLVFLSPFRWLRAFGHCQMGIRKVRGCGDGKGRGEEEE